MDLGRQTAVCVRAPRCGGHFDPTGTIALWAGRLQLKRDPFYESDCQGETSSPLIAGRSSPERSAPTVAGTGSGGALRSAGQSSSASVSSLSAPDPPLDDSQALGSRDARTMVLSETRPEAGLTLLRVLRGGLELGQFLGRLRAG